ncbi:MAG: hypothetical protein HC788_10840 [Sphingopyxis sp.]|nr:hypothetical protein [Sphingopyxis sp.]
MWKLLFGPALFCMLSQQVRAEDSFAKARADIDEFCSMTERSALDGCVKAQRESLARFVVIMAAFNDADDRTAKYCMVGAKAGRHIDWVIAKKCMQGAAKGLPVGGTLKQ